MTVDDNENFLSDVVIQNFKENDAYVNGNSETGLTSPVKKNKSERKTRKMVRDPSK